MNQTRLAQTNSLNHGSVKTNLFNKSSPQQVPSEKLRWNKVYETKGSPKQDPSIKVCPKQVCPTKVRRAKSKDHSCHFTPRFTLATTNGQGPATKAKEQRSKDQRGNIDDQRPKTKEQRTRTKDQRPNTKYQDPKSKAFCHFMQLSLC